MVVQKVLPIKDTEILHEVEDALLHNFKFGRRNFMIFKLGLVTMLRVSDLLALRRNEVFNDDGSIKSNAFTVDQKTGKHNILYLKPAFNDLAIYYRWLNENYPESEWLFPSSQHLQKHVSIKQYYKVMKRVGGLLNIDYLGTHTMRKTGAYRVYVQSNYDIALVMELLNHSSQKMTLRYLGLDQISKEKKLDQIKFD
ncbi:tyrosine-type recombinase/integrase [Limosilactobacillus vaginalis]|uniref:tyrosine-type recombinase/integrase n=1 Tax=Limosilactobacillus vaginalis TaxID=1633 RepID=UPI0025A3A095|nr:tyrosine-type recombinase/integrase [Limosilactobacillus vaginalis]MDM8265351.1 tyrosine-type recombinase/integrase [Limosilactobacillus vaginalis]HLQ75186.1 tyrosine-type recombinase/integrase [Alloiococcus sp.]